METMTSIEPTAPVKTSTRKKVVIALAIVVGVALLTIIGFANSGRLPAYHPDDKDGFVVKMGQGCDFAQSDVTGLQRIPNTPDGSLRAHLTTKDGRQWTVIQVGMTLDTPVLPLVHCTPGFLP